MKATLVSFALALALCGQAVAQEPSAARWRPRPRSALFDDESARSGPSSHARRRGNKMVEGSRSRAETPCQ